MDNVATARVTYPIVVKARNRLGDVRVLHRLGGGARSFAEAGADYYPTVLWSAERDHRLFEPGEPPLLSRDWHNPANLGPWQLVEVLAEHTSEDPMGAASRWPGAPQ